MGDLKTANEALIKESKHVASKDLEDAGDDNPDTQCGLDSCKPRGLQVFANMAAFTGFYSIAGLLSATLLSYVNSQVTTLERQFGLTSSETGIIMASNDIGYVVVVVFIGYFSRRVHIPRFLGASTMLFGISGIICCLPHFLYGVQKHTGTLLLSGNASFTSKESDVQICSLDNSSRVDFCGHLRNDHDLSGGTRPRQHADAALAIIAMGMVIQGMAKAPRHPFTITYIDDNVPKVQTGFYMGIIISLGIFGPAMAFGLGSYFTRLYVTLEETDLYPRHPKWIGAWWLGYLVFGATAIVLSLPLFFFPRKMKDAPEMPVQEKSEMGEKKTLQMAVIIAVKNYLQIILSLFTNPVYVCLVVSSVLHMFSIAGAHSFMPKYMETQFGLPAWKANLLMGTTTMCMASLGTFVGGWLTKRFKISPLRGLKFVIGIGFLTFAITCLGFVFGCPQPKILYQPGVSTAESKSCNNNCNCNDQDYFPICGSDNNNYYSPCFAGCLKQSGNLFENCTCIPEGGKAYAGLCDFDCPYLYPYIVANAVSALIATTMIMPKVLAKIRCVADSQKAMCVALSSFSTSIMGWLLGPIIFGRLIDSTCSIWDTSCGERGSCALYNIADYRIKMHGFMVGARFLGLMSLVVGFVFAVKTKVYEKFALPKSKDDIQPS